MPPTPDTGIARLAAVTSGGKAALAAALARLETAPEADDTLALLDAAHAAPIAHVIGITGPPGVGKSTLTGALITAWRKAGRTVGVIAVDPSSRRSGGALLGDRTRLRTDPADGGVFVRSMAARDRLGGLAELTLSAMVLMRALFDVVVIETVGVGQSETDVTSVADTVLLCLQPGSGDSLQFMKAGIVEIPHVMAVTKADLGEAASRARADALAILGQGGLGQGGLGQGGPGQAGAGMVPVILVSAEREEGIADLLGAIDRHAATLGPASLVAARAAQATAWIEDGVRQRFGREGWRRVEAGMTSAPAIGAGESPFRALARLARDLR